VIRAVLVPSGLLAALVAAALALGAPASDPGVTNTEVLIGGTVPLTGEAASGGLTALGADAYFKYVNARGGVNRRKIRYKYVDDEYDPGKTVQATRQLVLGDRVFAIFNSVGTAHNIAIRPYLNTNKVPQLFVASGWSGWGRQYRQFPYTIGFIPPYTIEGRIYARHVLKTRKNARIAVLYQDDEYGRELLDAFRKGLGRRSRQIAATASYDPAEPSVFSQVTRLKSSNANTLMLFAFGTRAIQAFVQVKRLGWKPQIYVNAVAAATSTMRVAASTGQTEGAISIAFFKDPADPVWRRDRGFKLYRAIMKRYLPGKSVTNAYFMAGMASAYAMTEALRKAGRNLTRAGLMRAVAHLDLRDPFVLPGIRVKTTPSDRFPIQQAQLERWRGNDRTGRWHAFGKVV
jgi:ABC-type branched-subunit amino acid transport system substrate-binding protein